MIKSSHFQKSGELKRNILLSPDRKVLYFSIPKCACSTIKVFLRTLYGQAPAEARQNPHSDVNNPLLNYSNLDGDRELNQLIEDKSVFKFSIIRDPRSRVFSAYKNKFIDAPIDVQKEFLGQLGLGKDYLDGSNFLSFDNFLEIISSQSSLDMNEHWRPMAFQLLGLGPNKVNLFSMDEIPLALKNVESFTGRTNPSESPSLNFSPHATNASKSSQVLSDDNLDKIINIYKNDLYLYLYRTSFYSI